MHSKTDFAQNKLEHFVMFLPLFIVHAKSDAFISDHQTSQRAQFYPWILYEKPYDILLITARARYIY